MSAAVAASFLNTIILIGSASDPFSSSILH